MIWNSNALTIGASSLGWIKYASGSPDSWKTFGSGELMRTSTATLVAGTVTVSDTAITANSIIRLSNRTIGGTPGAFYVSSRVAGTSFTITSTSGTDTSVVYYEIVSY